jgi:hypothetical protein
MLRNVQGLVVKIEIVLFKANVPCSCEEQIVLLQFRFSNKIITLAVLHFCHKITEYWVFSSASRLPTNCSCSVCCIIDFFREMGLCFTNALFCDTFLLFIFMLTYCMASRSKTFVRGQSAAFIFAVQAITYPPFSSKEVMVLLR